MRRPKMLHEPSDPGAIALVALRTARVALVGLVLLALVCVGVDLREAAGAVASMP